MEELLNNPLVVGVGGILIPILFTSVNTFLKIKKKQGFKVGLKHGKIVSALLQNKFPKLENEVELYSIEYFKGIQQGLRANNKDKQEKLKELVTNIDKIKINSPL